MMAAATVSAAPMNTPLQTMEAANMGSAQASMRRASAPWTMISSTGDMMRYLEDGRLLLDKGGVRDVDNIVEVTILPRMKYAPLRWAERTTSSAETMRLLRTWQ